MLIELRNDDTRPIYIQIMDEVKRAVTVGDLRPEDPLPSVRRLAGDLRVNANTVAQAYRDLEREGVVYVRRGQGTFIAAGTSWREDRGDAAREVAQRALQDAFRHGLDPDELIEAIRAVHDGAPVKQLTNGDER